MGGSIADVPGVKVGHRTLARRPTRGRSGGRPFKLTAAKLRLAQAAVGKPETRIAELCAELGVTRQTLYRHVTPTGEVRPDGNKLLGRKITPPRSPSVCPRERG
jgi:transposase-like protein